MCNKKKWTVQTGVSQGSGDREKTTTPKTKRLRAHPSIMATFITDVIITHNFTGDINFVGRYDTITSTTDLHQ